MLEENGSQRVRSPCHNWNLESHDTYIPLVWQHEWNSKWITYTPASLSAINTAYNKCRKTVTLPSKDPKTQIVVNFAQMYQKNVVSRYEQRIRCCIFDKNFYVWQWQDEFDEWNCYTPGVCLELELAYKTHKDNLKFYHKDDYQVNFKDLKQKNLNSGTERDVKREKIDVHVNDTITYVSVSFTNAFRRKCQNEIDSARMKVSLTNNSVDMLEGKRHLLEILGDVHFQRITQTKERRNKLDFVYKMKNCHLKVVNSQSKMYKVIQKYLLLTHGPTHTAYSMSIVAIYECQRDIEHVQFRDYGNNHLLWHGSRLSNFLGILTNGLKIAPKHVPSTGCMFGKGLYFSDVSSKSANYCRPTMIMNEGLLLLCEVALGDQEVICFSYHTAKNAMVQNEKQSVLVKGRFVPNPKCTLEISGMKIPYGKLVKYDKDLELLTLNYNEYIVYDVYQVKIRYLVHVKFNFA